MAFLYLTEQGAVLSKTGERLVVTKDDATLMDLPADKIDGVLVFGHVQLTTPALQLCLSHGVELALFTRRGRLLGQLTSPVPKNLTCARPSMPRPQIQNFLWLWPGPWWPANWPIPWPCCGNFPITTRIPNRCPK